jgi:hypothetical protein
MVSLNHLDVTDKPTRQKQYLHPRVRNTLSLIYIAVVVGLPEALIMPG